MDDHELRDCVHLQGCGVDLCWTGRGACIHAPRNWVGVFWVMIACDLAAAILALVWLKPVARGTIARAQEMALADQAYGALVASHSGS